MTKVILTEGQLKEIALLEQQEKLLCESLLSSMTIDDLKDKIKKAIIGGMALLSVIAAINKSNIDKKEKKILAKFAEIEAEEKQRLDSIYDMRVEACRKYMESALNNQGYNFNSTKLNPETLVSIADKYHFDLPFLMAVLHQESCFGSTPRARRTNSPFSVGSYDNGRNVVTYSDLNESITDYIKLLNKDYLISGKTIFDLMKPNSFVNKNGHRYAKDKSYEGKIKWLRDRIIKQFPELNS